MYYSETIQKVYRMDRHKIHLLRFILEGYDGMAMARTLDPKKGRVIIHIAPGCEDDIEMLIKDLSKEIMIAQES